MLGDTHQLQNCVFSCCCCYCCCILLAAGLCFVAPEKTKKKTHFRNPTNAFLIICKETRCIFVMFVKYMWINTHTHTPGHTFACDNFACIDWARLSTKTTNIIFIIPIFTSAHTKTTQCVCRRAYHTYPSPPPFLYSFIT